MSSLKAPKVVRGPGITMAMAMAMVLSMAAAFLAGCSPTPGAAPEVISVEWPTDALTTTDTATVSSTITVDGKTWKHLHAFLTVAEEIDGVSDFEETQVADATCAPRPGSPQLLDCEASLELTTGIWRYQWHVEFGQSGDKTALLSRPNPPEESFTVAHAADQSPAL